MPENVSIAYRGATYAIGQGPQFYGIWHAAATQSQPVEWWPLTPDGWSGAWSRFASIEIPGTIAPVTQEVLVQQGTAPPGLRRQASALAGPVTAGPDGRPAAAGPVAEPGQRRRPGQSADSAVVARGSRIAAGLLGLGVVLGIAGLFPAYVAGASLASQPSDVVPHAIYLAAWSLSGVLVVLGGMRLRAGALIGIGVSAVTFGLFFADAGTQAASGTHAAGCRPGPEHRRLGCVHRRCGAGVPIRALWKDGHGQERGRPAPRSAGPAPRRVESRDRANLDAGAGGRGCGHRVRPVVGQVHAADRERSLADHHRGQCVRQPRLGDHSAMYW